MYNKLKEMWKEAVVA